jgi:hypothetical protein
METDAKFSMHLCPKFAIILIATNLTNIHSASSIHFCIGGSGLCRCYAA